MCLLEKIDCSFIIYFYSPNSYRVHQMEDLFQSRVNVLNIEVVFIWERLLQSPERRDRKKEKENQERHIQPFISSNIFLTSNHCFTSPAPRVLLKYLQNFTHIHKCSALHIELTFLRETQILLCSHWPVSSSHSNISSEPLGWVCPVTIPIKFIQM